MRSRRTRCHVPLSPSCDLSSPTYAGSPPLRSRRRRGLRDAHAGAGRGARDAAARRRPPVARTDTGPRTGSRTEARAADLHGEARRHALQDRARQRPRLSRARRVERDRELNVIREGQLLRLAAPGEGRRAAPAARASRRCRCARAAGGHGDARPPAARPVHRRTPLAVPPGARNTDNYKTQPKALKEPYSEQALRDVQRSRGGRGAAVPAAAPSRRATARRRARRSRSAEPKPAPEAAETTTSSAGCGPRRASS